MVGWLIAYSTWSLASAVTSSAVWGNLVLCSEIVTVPATKILLGDGGPHGR